MIFRQKGGVKPPQSKGFAANYAAFSESFAHVPLISKAQRLVAAGSNTSFLIANAGNQKDRYKIIGARTRKL